MQRVCKVYHKSMAKLKEMKDAFAIFEVDNQYEDIADSIHENIQRAMMFYNFYDENQTSLCLNKIDLAATLAGSKEASYSQCALVSMKPSDSSRNEITKLANLFEDFENTQQIEGNMHEMMLKVNFSSSSSANNFLFLKGLVLNEGPLRITKLATDEYSALNKPLVSQSNTSRGTRANIRSVQKVK
jgi:hypothetical protein